MQNKKMKQILKHIKVFFCEKVFIEAGVLVFFGAVSLLKFFFPINGEPIVPNAGKIVIAGLIIWIIYKGCEELILINFPEEEKKTVSK